MKAIIGVDIGTTGCRAVLYSQDGTALANQSLEYPLHTPQPTWAEQDPEIIYRAVLAVIRQAVLQAGLPQSSIAGMCFSSVYHGVIAVDTEGTALCPAIIWADTRSQQYTEQLKGSYDTAAIYSRTGCPMHPMYLPSKILWFKNERPDIFRRAAKFISVKEYVLYRLTGQYAIDKSIASGTGLYNIRTLEWDTELLSIVGLEVGRLSPALSTTHCIQGLNPEIARDLGVSPDLPVVLGAGDGALSSVGSGAVNPGQLTAMIGTSGAVRMISATPKTDVQGRTWCYNLTDDYWVLGGAINNGGIALQWLRDKLAGPESLVAKSLGQDVYDLLTRYAEQVPAGSDGLLLLPFYTGERAPYWNANARGVLFGLNLNHDKRHIVRATLEGITYRMFSIFSALEEVSGGVQEIRVSGSFTRSRLWLQIMADIFGRTIRVPGEPQGSAFGACVLGMYALGLLSDIKDVGNYMNITAEVQPNPDSHQLYKELFAIYQRVYWNLQQEFTAISAIQRKG